MEGREKRGLRSGWREKGGSSSGTSGLVLAMRGRTEREEQVRGEGAERETRIRE